MTYSHRSMSDVLDECLDRVLSAGEDPESCLAEYPEFETEIREALATAGVVKAAAASIPSNAAKRYASRQRFLEALDKRRAATPWWRMRWLNPLVATGPRLAATAAVALAVVLGSGTGTVLASQATVPGDPLYPVKRAVEQTQLAFASGDREAELHAKLLDRRVAELDTVVQRQGDRFVPGLVEQIREHSERARVLTAAPLDVIMTDEPRAFSPEAAPEVVTEQDRTQTASVSPMLALTRQLQHVETRIAEIEGNTQDERVKENLQRALQTIEETQSRVGELLQRVDRMMPRDTELPTSEEGDEVRTASDQERPTTPASDRSTPAPPPTPAVGPATVSEGHRFEEIEGTIDDVSVTVGLGGRRMDIRIRLTTGERVSVQITANSRIAGPAGPAKVADLAPGMRIAGTISRETGEVRSLRLLGEGEREPETRPSPGPPGRPEPATESRSNAPQMEERPPAGRSASPPSPGNNPDVGRDVDDAPDSRSSR